MVKRGNKNPYLAGKSAKKHLNWVLREQPNPFGHLDEATREQVIRVAGEKASQEFLANTESLQRLIRSCNVMQILAHFAYYDQIWYDGVEDSNGYTPTQQSAVEWLQALILQVPLNQLNTVLDEAPSGEVLMTANKSLNAAQRAYGTMRMGRKRDESGAVFAAELVRQHTAFIRNEGYPTQIRRIQGEIFRPIDQVFRAREGFSLSELVAALWGLLEMIQKRIEDDMVMRKKVLGQRTPDRVVVEFANAIKQPLEQIRHGFASFIQDDITVRTAVMNFLDSGNFKFFYFSQDEFRSLLPADVSLKAVQTILAQLSIGWGDLANEKPEHLILNNPVWRQPVIAVGNRSYFFPIISLIQSFGLEIVEAFLRPHKDLWDRYCDKIRADYLENRTEEVIRKAFPMASVFRGLKWIGEVEGKNWENDVLVLLDTHALVIECKSGQMRPRAQRGDVAALRDEIGKLIGEASEQGNRFADFLLRQKQVVTLYDVQGVEHKLDLRHLLRATTVNVLLEYLGPIHTQHQLLRSTGMVGADVAPTATMPLHDLECVLEILDRPALAFHYFQRRAEIESSNEMMTEELGFLAMYLATAFDIGDFEGNPEHRFAIPAMANELTPYFMGKEIGAPVPKPKLRLRAWWAEMLERFAEQKFTGWMECSYTLLCAGYQRHEQFDKLCRRLIRNVRSNWHQQHDDTCVMILGASKRRLAIICVVLKDETQDEAYAIFNDRIQRAEEEHSVQRSLVITLSAKKRSRPYFGAYFHTAELQNMGMDEAVKPLSSKPKP